MDANIFVNPKACGCRKPQRHCNRVVLESRTGNFVLRFLNRGKAQDGQLEGWDLSVFNYPRTGKFKQAILHEKVETLDLQFTDETGKCDFPEDCQIIVSPNHRKKHLPRGNDIARKCAYGDPEHI